MADSTLVNGTSVRVQSDFFDGIARFDPTSVTFKIMDPVGTVIAYSYGTASNVTKISTGRFACDVNATSVGLWHYRIESTTGGLNGDAEGTFTVVPSVFL